MFRAGRLAPRIKPHSGFACLRCWLSCAHFPSACRCLVRPIASSSWATVADQCVAERCRVLACLCLLGCMASGPCPCGAISDPCACWGTFYILLRADSLGLLVCYESSNAALSLCLLRHVWNCHRDMPFCCQSASSRRHSQVQADHRHVSGKGIQLCLGAAMLYYDVRCFVALCAWCVSWGRIRLFRLQAIASFEFLIFARLLAGYVCT
jgi:hypothetical protein